MSFPASIQPEQDVERAARGKETVVQIRECGKKEQRGEGEFKAGRKPGDRSCECAVLFARQGITQAAGAFRVCNDVIALVDRLVPVKGNTGREERERSSSLFQGKDRV